MKKPKTHIQKRRDEIEATKQKIMAIFGMDEEQYNMSFFENAYKWIDDMNYGYMSYITKSSLFWKWWKNTYHMNNLDFLEYMKVSQHKDTIINDPKKYLYIYNDCHLIMKYVIPSNILDRIFKEVEKKKAKENEPQLQ